MDSKGEIQIMSDEEAQNLVIQLTSASLLSTVIKTAIELGVFGIIATKADARAFLSPSEIASHLPNNKNHDAPAMLDRMLRLLACYSILTHSLRELPDGKVERLYGLGPIGKFLTNNKDGVSMAPLCLFTEDKVSRESGNHLKDAILEGVVPFEKAHGMTLFKYEGIDARFNNIFNSAMSNYSTMIMKKMLDTYKGFEGLNSLVDVAGGTGASLSMIVSKYPLIKGINFDLPHVIANAPSYPGVEHVGGDIFASLPKGDAIFMKSICHDWSDEYCLRLLKNCYDAIPENGKVIVAERIIPVAVDSSLATKETVHADILMLTNHPGGKERTEKEFQALATAAGFRGFRVMCRAFNTYVMEFLKKEI